MTSSKLTARNITRLLTGTFISLIIGSTVSIAEEKFTFSNLKTIKALEFNNNIKVSGIRLSKGIYLGHAKVADNYGLGFVVNNSDYTWAINHRGLSILKRF